MTVPGASIASTERTKALGIGMSIDGRRILEMAEVYRIRIVIVASGPIQI
jgi:hypothetical protein